MSSETVSRTGRPSLRRHVRLSWDRTRGRHVLLLPETVVALNPTGADILQRCDGQRTVAEIVAELATAYGRDATAIEGEVATFLTALAARRHVEIAE